MPETRATPQQFQGRRDLKQGNKASLFSKHGPICSIATAVAVTLFVSACSSGGGDDSTMPDVTPPRVTSIGATRDVPIGAVVALGFSEALDCTSVTADSLRVDGVAGTVSCGGAAAAFSPATNLAYSTTYTVTLVTGTSGIRDLAGNGLSGVNSLSFTTVAVPVPGNSFSFLAYGDSRAGENYCSGNATHISLVNRMANEISDFVFHLGDMVTGYNNTTNWVQNGDCTGANSYGSFRNIIAPLQNKTPAPGLPVFYFPVVGNHDDYWGGGWYPDAFGNGFCDVFNPLLLVPNHTRQTHFSGIGTARYTDSEFYSLACSKSSGAVYSRYFYYSFNYKNAHFVVLRVNSDFHDLEECGSCGPDRSDYGDYYNIHQLDWLRADLGAANADPAIEHIIVLLHAPLFTTSAGHNANTSWLTLSQEFSKHGVKLVLSGHNHVYERTVPIYVSAAYPNGVADTVNGTTYLVTGGGGSLLHGFSANEWFIAARTDVHHYVKIEINGSTIAVHAIRPDGTVVDSFVR